MKRFTLYGSPHSLPTFKVAIVLHISGEPFSFRYVSFQKDVHKTPEFQALSRWGQVPVLLDNERIHLQSSAIVEHLADALGRFQGTDAATLPIHSRMVVSGGRRAVSANIQLPRRLLGEAEAAADMSSRRSPITMLGAPRRRYRCWTRTSPRGAIFVPASRRLPTSSAVAT